MNREVLKGLAQQRTSRPRLARGQVLALALLSASFVAGGRAEAACTTIGTTVECTGINNPGFGAPTDNGLTYHVGFGASITAAGTPGIRFNNDGTVNVDRGGSISSDADGIDNGNASVNNAGVI